MFYHAIIAYYQNRVIEQADVYFHLLHFAISQILLS